MRVLSATQSLPASNEPSITLAEWLHSLLSQAASVNLAAVGWVGVAVIGYAAVSLIATIENSFNTIYRASGRSTLDPPHPDLLVCTHRQSRRNRNHVVLQQPGRQLD